MPNIFEEVLNDANAVQTKLLGPDYPYYKNIKTPDELGMSSKGSISTLVSDIKGIGSYAEILVSGGGNASATGKPLGNKFFLKTGATCLDEETNQDVDRHIYINNVPQGNIPIISSGIGVNFTEFRGLIPGTLSNLNVLNPYAIMGSFLSGSKPPCQSITLETIDANNNHSSESHYLTLVDIKNMDPCNFSNGKNPITGTQCRETFKSPLEPELIIPDDWLAQLFIISCCFIIIYVIYKKIK